MKSEEELMIDGCDYLFSHVPDYGVFNAVAKITGFSPKTDDFELSIDIFNRVSMNRWDFVVDYADKKGYIIHPKDNSSSSMFSLTDLGREIKKRSGVKNYQKWVSANESAFLESVRYAKESAGAAIESAKAAREAVDIAKENTGYTRNTMHWIAAYTIITFIIMVTTILICNQNGRSNSSQANTPNSSTEAKASKVTDTVR